MGFSLSGALSGALAGGSVGGMPGAIAGGALGGFMSGGEEERLNESNKISEQAYQNLDPYRQAGNVALNQYMQLLGLTPIGTSPAAADVPVQAPDASPSSLVGLAGWTEEDEREWNNMYDSSDHPPDPRRVQQLEQKRAAAMGAAGAAQRAPSVPTMGAPGSGQPAQPRTIEDMLRATPGYAFQVAEEERAIERAAAGRGQRISGNVLEELASRAGQRAIGTAYQGQLENLARLTAGGQNAAAGQGGIASGISGRRYDAAQAGNESRDTLLASGIQAAGAYFGRKS